MIPSREAFRVEFGRPRIRIGRHERRCLNLARETRHTTGPILPELVCGDGENLLFKARSLQSQPMTQRVTLSKRELGNQEKFRFEIESEEKVSLSDLRPTDDGRVMATVAAAAARRSGRERGGPNVAPSPLRQPTADCACCAARQWFLVVLVLVVLLERSPSSIGEFCIR